MGRWQLRKFFMPASQFVHSFEKDGHRLESIVCICKSVGRVSVDDFFDQLHVTTISLERDAI